MNAIQLDFFKTETECIEEDILQRLGRVEVSTEKVRKKLFAENTETRECVRTLIRLFLDIDERMKLIERSICSSEIL